MTKFKLPVITEVEHHTYAPGDMFIIHCDDFIPDMQTVQDICDRFRTVMALPESVRIAVFHQGLRLEVISEETYPDPHESE